MKTCTNCHEKFSPDEGRIDDGGKFLCFPCFEESGEEKSEAECPECGESSEALKVDHVCPECGYEDETAEEDEEEA
jgi:predicted CXXCH cytochrome family protein